MNNPLSLCLTNKKRTMSIVELILIVVVSYTTIKPFRQFVNLLFTPIKK
jgi:hypothetical protein